VRDDACPAIIRQEHLQVFAPVRIAGCKDDDLGLSAVALACNVGQGFELLGHFLDFCQIFGAQFDQRQRPRADQNRVNYPGSGGYPVVVLIKDIRGKRSLGEEADFACYALCQADPTPVVAAKPLKQALIGA
jgi:hypothetical protein